MDEASKLEAQGSLDQALAAYVREQQWPQAARLAVRLDRPGEAGRFWLQAGQPYDAAVCFQRASMLKECLDALLLVPNTEPRYRAACVHAIRLTVSLGEPMDRLGSFLMSFANTPPASPVEAAALNQVAQLYAEGQAFSLAAAIYRRVLASYPADADAREGLAALPPGNEPSDAASNARPSSNPARPMSNPAAVQRPSTSTSGSRPALTVDGRRPQTMSGRKRLGEILLARGKVTQENLDRVLKTQKDASSNDILLGEALVAHGLLTDVEVVKALSEQSGIPYIGEGRLLNQTSPEALKLLTLEQVEKYLVMPVAIVDKKLYLAMKNPADFTLLDQLRFATGMKHLSGIYATEGSIRKGIAKFYKGEFVFESDDWRGKVYEPGSGESAPFSDRVTRTREREFDTTEMEKKALLEAAGQLPVSPTPVPAVPAVNTNPSLAAAPTAAPGMTMDMPRKLLAGGTPEVGQTIAERYRIDAKLGEGGSAMVFKVMDLELNEPVAIKLFRPSLQTDALVARFKLELSLSRQLNHPNIVRLFDMGQHEGWRYITLELLDGEDVATVLKKFPRGLPLQVGINILEQAASGLQAAHDRGVIHRDVKPQNLFVTRDGSVKVMDFGIAKKEHTPGVTVEGMMAGTPEFMSPEQINGFSTVGIQTDLYSLGATAYAMFTGTPPFESAKLMDILMAHMNTPPPPPRGRNPDLPAELEAIILKLLEKDPAQRLQSCRELVAAVQQLRVRLTA
ncbi:MAG: protein kinase [Deltaproteobacteria bacterium]|nr:protein kinase [Deltaproteobacteria bacterium]